MPKVEINEKLFFDTLGRAPCKSAEDWEKLEKLLTFAKAELDEKSSEADKADERKIKIELNDTNRPDLWSTMGLARALRQVQISDDGQTGEQNSKYDEIMSKPGSLRDAGERVVSVDERLRNIRPYMSAFIITGKPISNAMLIDIIQTQEKLTWNFGRKRKSISMGIYRIRDIKFPVHYDAVDPDKTSFVPLGCEEAMTCRDILSNHPKGRDYGWILKDSPLFPLLRDDKGEVMSMAPIINSASLGAVKVGDDALMVEMTGDNIDNLLLCTNIVACDFFDEGYKIEPICCHHPYDTGYGRDIVSPFYFQKPTRASIAAINKLLGSDFDAQKICLYLNRMGDKVKVDGDTVTVEAAPYRNDFLHEVDVAEDVMIGAGLDNFLPLSPNDFTIGALLPITKLSRKVKSLLVGLGYQEMIFGYVGSATDYIDKMRLRGTVAESSVIEISNPMSENYQFVRSEIASSLLRSESGARKAVFPHKTFEIGKVAFVCEEDPAGTRTEQHLGFLFVDEGANFNSMASEVQSLLYYLDTDYHVSESSDSRFIAGRQADIQKDGKVAGVFGELHPEVLTNWGITTPAVYCELNLEAFCQEN